MPREAHTWQKSISLPRLIPVHSSCLYPVWFSFAQTALLSPVPALRHHIPKGSTPQKVRFSLCFLLFCATVTSSHHTICSSSLPHWAVSGLWNLTVEVTSPSWSPARSQQKSGTAVGALCSPQEPDKHLKTRVKARPHSTFNQLPLLMLWGFWDTDISYYLAVECLCRSSHLVEVTGCFTTQNLLPILLQTVCF